MEHSKEHSKEFERVMKEYSGNGIEHGKMMDEGMRMMMEGMEMMKKAREMMGGTGK